MRIGLFDKDGACICLVEGSAAKSFTHRANADRATLNRLARENAKATRATIGSFEFTITAGQVTPAPMGM